MNLWAPPGNRRWALFYALFANISLTESCLIRCDLDCRETIMPGLHKFPGRGFTIRVYDLARELKLDNKRIIEDARREGINVKSPSNTLPHVVAELIRKKYFPAKPRQDMRPRLIKANREYIALTEENGTIRVVSLKSDGTYSFLDDAQNLHNIVYIPSSETLRLLEAVDELETIVNNPKAKESHFQDFFERNQSFILNDEYKRAHSHLVLARDDRGPLVPDFVLEPFNQQALCDVLELKLPSVQIFRVQKNRTRFSSAVLEACAQLREYSTYFDEANNRKAIFKKYGLQAFRPKMFVIIGRRGKIDPIEVRKMESDLPNLHLRTYDDLIDRFKAKADAMRKRTVLA